MPPRTMRAAVITRPGGPETLALQERPVPVPNAHEVLVRVHASAMNRADVLQRQGRYPAPAGAPPDVPGLELAGTVVAQGPAAHRWPSGSRVFGLVAGGAHADYAVAHEDTLAAIPAALDWVSAGAVPEAFITAFDALEQAAAHAGEVVLIHAVASGVGLAAVQLVRARGAQAIGTSRSGEKLARAAALGLHAGYDAEAGLEGLTEWIRQSTDGRGADVALDLVGGPYVRPTIEALAPRGRLVVIGTVAGREATLPLGIVLQRRLTIRGTVLRTRALEERMRDAAAFAREVVPLLQRGVVHPVIDRVIPLERIADAHAAVESNATTGKVVITMTRDQPTSDQP
ncbi:MAG TPA: NAD(P)H-quinone oxidoreductase [Gemmatimonadaceae bacterium]|nr:NAD(P)H-quinone oxidoreductase [Gemmatimonadaceae bacterium]